MSISSPAKQKTYHKKRTAGHHRHSQHYLKTYWPYLPIALIVFMGITISRAFPSSISRSSLKFTPVHNQSSVNRLASLTGHNYSSLTEVIIVIALMALIALIISHSPLVRRTLKKSELLAIKHPYLESLIVAIVMLAYILSASVSLT